MIANVINFLGTSKLTLHALVPFILEHSKSRVLIATTNTKLRDVQKVVIDESGKYDYYALCVENEESMDEVLRKMDSKDIRVAIINTSSPLFVDMLKNGNGGVWLAACREGLAYYLPLIQRYATKPTTVLCFDNDETLIKRFQGMYPDISVYKCVAHSICSSVYYNTAQNQIVLSGRGECFLYFPPEAAGLQPVLCTSRNTLSTRVQIRFTKTTEEFRFYTCAKLIDIDAIHTVLCVMAYVEGVRRGRQLDVISEMRFSDLLEPPDAMTLLKQLHVILFDNYLYDAASKIGELQIVYMELSIAFVEYLFSSKVEKVKHGLDWRDSSFHSKVDRHFPLLRSAENEYINKLLDDFENLFLE